MENRILDIEFLDRSLDPATAEVHVFVRVAIRTPTTEIRGRLMGPQCKFASTVEIAYPLRPIATNDDRLAARVVIPEASFWDPQSPFLYGGPVELWQDGQRCGVVTVGHGLRQVRWGPRGLTINGRSIAVCAKRLAATVSDDEALGLRRAGYNLIIAPVREITAPLWDLGDRFGFAILGQADVIDMQTRTLIAILRRHASCAGWLADTTSLPGEMIVPANTLRLLGSID
jgi:hypothetical protein